MIPSRKFVFAKEPLGFSLGVAAWTKGPNLTPSSDDADAVKQAVRDANLEPPSDVHASSDYRRHLAEVLAARAVDQARGAA